MPIKTKTSTIKDIFHKYKGGKRKLFETRINNPESDNWTRQQMADHIGVSKVTLYSYLSDTELAEDIITCCKLLYAYDMPTIVRSTRGQAIKGDIQASKLIHDAVKLTGSGNNQTVNVGISQDEQTVEFVNDADKQAYADQLQAELDAFKASIGKPDRLGGHGIHPEAGGHDGGEE